jgi:hypothetical protein
MLSCLAASHTLSVFCSLVARPSIRRRTMTPWALHARVLLVALFSLVSAISAAALNERQAPQAVQAPYTMAPPQLIGNGAYHLTLGSQAPALPMQTLGTSASSALSAAQSAIAASQAAFPSSQPGSSAGSDVVPSPDRPLTIEATPLDESGSGDDASDTEFMSSLSSEAESALEHDSDSDSDDESNSSGNGRGSGSRGSVLGLLSGSSSLLRGSCGCPPKKPKRKCPVGIPPGPCGGGGPLKEAKIVDKLSGSKKYNTVLPGQAIWTFTDGTYSADQNQVTAEVQSILKDDVILQQLMQKLENLKDKMENEQLWVEDVQKMVTHYKAKAVSVSSALKAQMNEMKTLKAMIEARKKMAARKALEKKLLKVNAQLQQLQATTSSVSGEAKSLVAVQQALNKSIQGIQSEIERLRSAK